MVFSCHAACMDANGDGFVKTPGAIKNKLCGLSHLHRTFCGLSPIPFENSDSNRTIYFEWPGFNIRKKVAEF